MDPLETDTLHISKWYFTKSGWHNIIQYFSMFASGRAFKEPFSFGITQIEQYYST